MKKKPSPTVLIKMCVGLLWLVFFSLLLKRDVFIDTINLGETEIVKRAESEEYQGIYFRDSKIGFVVTRYNGGPDSTQQLEQEATMNLNIAQTVQTITLRLKATLSSANYLQDFLFSFNSPFYTMEATGRVEGTSIHYQLDTGSNTVKDTLNFQTSPLLATSRRAYLLSDGLKTGDKKRVPWFDPMSLTSKQSILEYRGQESVLIGGRVQKLHHFIESFSGARVNSWLNDAGVVVKEESPAGFVFLKEPKFKAIDLSGKKVELLDAVAVKFQGSLGDISGPNKLYRLTLPDNAEFDLDGGRQLWSGQILTLTREELPTGSATRVCSDGEPFLAATPYIQADRKEFADMAREILSNVSHPLDKVRKLATWVYENLEKRPVIGLPDAMTTLQSRQGDCNEHAALFAALARAAGIPTRIATGVTFQRQAFYYHAWNEVCLNDKWISIDTTTNQLPADLTHIRFIIGEMQEQVRLGALLGALSIEPLDPQKN